MDKETYILLSESIEDEKTSKGKINLDVDNKKNVNTFAALRTLL
jgi:uncharacterized protein YuzE